MKPLHPIFALTLAILPACGSTSTSPTPEPELGEADHRVLFVGNSLTYTNDLPAMVVTVGEAAGTSVAVASIARPNFALEDHWRDGIADRIRTLRPDVVVMQQGPSSLAESRVHLRAWTDTLARVVREVGGTPALLMVWPSEDRMFAFDDVRESYRLAAADVGGTFVPAGEAWREAWSDDPGLALFGPDGFHPSALGTALTALTVAHVLFDVPLSGLPHRLERTDGTGPVLQFSSPEAADLLYAAVERAVEAWR